METPPLAHWFETQGFQDLTQITKESPETLAWFASASGRDTFLKLYPHTHAETPASTEIAIAGADLHPAIIPLRQTATCREGTLLLYDRVPGENLGATATRSRFQGLPLAERTAAVFAALEALSTVTEAGYMVVDWYEGNMIYDFDQKRIWLFDWELCRKAEGFLLEMDSNYGSSRLMAPEEFLRGSWLDQRTIVFNLGRYVLLTLPEFAGTLAPILARATYPARSERYATVREFTHTFVKAASPAATQNQG